MKVYPSKSSKEVLLITVGILISIILAITTLFVANGKYGVIAGTLLSLILVGTILYFYVNSLKEIVVDDKMIILKKKFGAIKIPLTTFEKIVKLEYANLSMTFGSKGVFGFIGNTMDNSISLVKDRRKMVRIETHDKKYILSVDEPSELVNDIKKVTQQRI